MCQCCYDVNPDIFDYICPRCLKQWRVIQRIYTLTAPWIASLRDKTVSQFVVAMWKKLRLDKRKHLVHTTKPKTEETE